MIPLPSILLLAAAVLTVFCQAAVPEMFHWFGARVSLLPALMVYASLETGIVTVALTATVGGLCFDSLSMNPLGISVLPLFIVGFGMELRRELILREQLFAQIVLGLLASTLVPALTIVLLLSGGKNPLLGWGTLGQWLVMTLAGGVATPVLFECFGWLNRSLGYRPVSESSFHPDREIRRGRH